MHGTSRGLWNSIVSAATRRLRPSERAIRTGTIKQGLASAVMKSVAKQLSALSAVTRPDGDDGSLGYSGTEDEDYVQPGGGGGAAGDSDTESEDGGSH